MNNMNKAYEILRAAPSETWVPDLMLWHGVPKGQGFCAEGPKCSTLHCAAGHLALAIGATDNYTPDTSRLRAWLGTDDAGAAALFSLRGSSKFDAELGAAVSHPYWIGWHDTAPKNKSPLTDKQLALYRLLRLMGHPKETALPKAIADGADQEQQVDHEGRVEAPGAGEVAPVLGVREPTTV